ncbi:hypothetical protein M0R45_025860 [Rubus argutus]|uniref:Uncharacterized protein n=1 Tax=Rubus argutus TaxID=59490 RepID=A0AAW1WY60_RUBAR
MKRRAKLRTTEKYQKRKMPSRRAFSHLRRQRHRTRAPPSPSIQTRQAVQSAIAVVPPSRRRPLMPSPLICRPCRDFDAATSKPHLPLPAPPSPHHLS